MTHVPTPSATAVETTLPRPTGSRGVGVTDIELVTPPRADGEDRLLVRAWYPAASGSHRPPRPYATDAERAMLRSWIQRRNPTWRAATSIDLLAEMSTHSVPEAPVVGRDHPVIVFSHGADMYPGQSTALMEDLASHGFVVLSLLQSGGGFGVGPDGVASQPHQHFFDGAVDLFERLKTFMAAGNDIAARLAWHQEVAETAPAAHLVREWRDRMIAVARAAVGPSLGDGSAVLASIDPTRLVYAGMSLGGSAAISAAHHDPRAVAAVNLDGMHYGDDLLGRQARTPVLALSADQANVADYREGDQGQHHYNDLFYESFEAMGQRADVVRLRIKGTMHRDFSDLTLIPGKQRLDRLGSADGVLVTVAVREIVRGFLDEHVRQLPPAVLPTDGVGIESIDVGHVRRWAAARRSRPA